MPNTRSSSSKSRKRFGKTTTDPLIRAPFDWTWVIGVISQIAEIGRLSDAKGGGLWVRSWSTTELWGQNRMAKVLMAEKLGPTKILRNEDVMGVQYFFLEGTDPNAKAIEIICHVDTVKNGGRWDGRLGFAIAASIVRALGILGIRLRHNLIITCYRGEEADELGVGTVASSVISGRITPKEFTGMKNRDGVTVGEILSKELTTKSFRARKAAERAGKELPAPVYRDLNKLFDIDWRVLAQERCAVIEVHIEQGKAMLPDDSDTIFPGVAVSPSLAGPNRWTVTINGESGHSGATPMVRRFEGTSVKTKDLVSARRDPMRAAAHMCEAAYRLSDKLSAQGSQHRFTITDMEPTPGGRTQIPGSVDIHMEIRDTDAANMDKLYGQISASWLKLAESHDVSIGFERNATGGKVDCDSDFIQNAFGLAEQLSIPTQELTCFARHDIANIIRAGVPGLLLLTRCPNGSHVPDEDVSENDFHQSLDLAFGMVLDIDAEMD